MKKVILLICSFVLLLTCSSVATAQTNTFFETQTMATEVYDNWVVDVGVFHRFSDNWKIRTFFLMKNSWGQAHLGPIWQPLDWLQVGVSVGVRKGIDGWDFQTSYLLVLSKKKFSFVGMVEAGRLAYAGDHDQVWYDLTVRWKAMKWLTIGLKDRRPAGVGPLVEFHFWKLTAWAAWVPMDSEAPEFDWPRTLLGLKICL